MSPLRMVEAFSISSSSAMASRSLGDFAFRSARRKLVSVMEFTCLKQDTWPRVREVFHLCVSVHAGRRDMGQLSRRSRYLSRNSVFPCLPSKKEKERKVVESCRTVENSENRETHGLHTVLFLCANARRACFCANC
jgi:hypothetical protein